MTREEEIVKQADIYTDDASNYAEWSVDGGWSEENDIKLIKKAFIAGAKWADETHGKELMYAIQKTGERTKREVINKACEWLENELFEDVAEPNPYYYTDVKSKTHDCLKDFIAEFREAMEE